MFVHLRSYSEYSMLKSSLRVQNLVDLCIKHKMPAIALTDSWNLSGAFEFSELAAKNGVQPIIGCEVELEDFVRQCIIRVVLLAKNEAGFRNLSRFIHDSTLSKKNNNNHVLKIDELYKYKDGLILLSGFKNGLLDVYLSKHDGIDCLKQIFAEFNGNAYIELQVANEPLKEISVDYAYQNNIPLVATNNICFASEDIKDYNSCDALQCIASGTYFSERDKRSVTKSDFFESQEKMKIAFSNIPEALENTISIAKRCLFFVKERSPMLPKFTCKVAATEDEELRIYAKIGLEERLASGIISAETSAYRERLEFELSVINSMKFAGYFLIVSDFVRWAKNNGVSVGPGRGSGAGSVVAWALSITDLDPIRFGLIFERFLNPERISLPDFDIDFCQELRFRVVEYVMNKYGNVAHIVTFGKLQAKAVLRDVGRILQLPYSQVDRICKMIPFNPINPVGLAEAIEMDSNLRKEKENGDETLRQLFDISFLLEGLCRHRSVHAAGIVISDKPLSDYIPVYYDDHTELPVTQYNMKYTEKAGLVKFDFLGLKTLTLIDKALSFVGDSGKKIDISLIPLDDQLAYELMSKGDTLGVFQLESSGMKDVLIKLKPDCIEDIIAVISLYRPGPMDNIAVYIGRKHGLQPVDAIHPMLESVLKETFGVIVYQEQVMEIARVMAGYSLGKADLLRRAMGKKIKSEMDEQQEVFVEGSIRNGVDREKAESIFELVAKFAGYGFNKSHAAAYAVIAYRTAYLKAHHRVEFFAALMNLDIHDKEKLGDIFYSAKQSGLTILPPDINASSTLFSIENGCIRYGLAALKNIGIKPAQYIISKRITKFLDTAHFMSIIADSGGLINRKVLESLIKSGAMVSIHSNQKQLLNSLDGIVSMHYGSKELPGQYSMFGEEVSMHLTEVQDFSRDEKLDHEFSIFGFYLSGHPLSRYVDILKKLNISCSDKTSKSMMLVGVVISSKMRSSAKARFIIVNLSGVDATYEFAVYDRALIEKSELFVTKSIIVVTLESIISGEDTRLIAKKVHYLEDILQKLRGKIMLHIGSGNDVFERVIWALSLHGNDNKGLSIFAFCNVDEHTVRVSINRKLLLSLKVLDELLSIEGLEVQFELFRSEISVSE